MFITNCYNKESGDLMSELPNKKRKKRKHPFLRFLLLILVLGMIFAGCGAFYVYKEISPSGDEGITSTITIPQGASTSSIATILKENELIDNALVFKAYSRFIALSDGSFNYGDFTINSADSYDDIIHILQQSNTDVEVITVTFPEGYNAYQIGAELEKNGLGTQEAFIDALNTLTFDYDFIDQVTANPLKLVKLEGFLFPDTYVFYPDENMESIINRMLKNFETKALTDENITLLADSGLTLEEWVTLSSIIQKESANTTEMYNVASVFHNRLDESGTYPKLESCTTRDFIEDYIHPEFDNNPPIEVLEGYDTYGSAGLPIGAITNPGVDALNATLRPNDTPYYFFVTDVEYTHYYGETFQDHLNNIVKAKAVNKTHGIDGLIS